MADEIWINGVNVALSPSFPRDGLCPTCRKPFVGIKASTNVEPWKVKGPYFTPCKHDAASVFGGRRAVIE